MMSCAQPTASTLSGINKRGIRPPPESDLKGHHHQQTLKASRIINYSTNTLESS
jgi:hypothetical protein